MPLISAGLMSILVVPFWVVSDDAELSPKRVG